MKCPFCHAEVSVKSAICPVCGASTVIPLREKNHWYTGVINFSVNNESEEINVSRQRGSLLLAGSGVIFLLVSSLLLVNQIFHVLHGMPAEYFRYSIFAEIPILRHSALEPLPASIPLPFATPVEILLFSVWMLLPLAYGFCGLLLLFRYIIRIKPLAVIALILSFLVCAVRLVFVQIQASMLFAVLTTLVPFACLFGSLRILRGTRQVLPEPPAVHRPWKLSVLILYSTLSIVFITILLLFRYGILFP